MQKQRFVRSYFLKTACVGLIFSAIFLSFSFVQTRELQAASQVHQIQPLSTQLYVFRVYVHTKQDIKKLTSGNWDVLEARGEDYLLVLGSDQVAEELRQEGFRVEIHERLPQPSTEQALFFEGYRTVAEHYQHMDAIAAAHPDLATVVDFGDSWRKVNNQPNGHDLKAILITKLRPGDPVLDPNVDKPRFLMIAACHARELSTSELAWRWMDHLVDNYGLDPEITELINTTELWIIPVANPDGRHIVEQGGDSPYLQRKNANTTTGNCSDPPTVENQFGVDLNRNASFTWASDEPDPCGQTYSGPTGASEPEEYFLEAFLRQLFHDQRGSALTDAAPLSTTGAVLNLHSYGNLVLFPWAKYGFRAPNDTGLRSLGFRLSYYNEYIAGQPSQIISYAAGSTDDFVYGELGVASTTFEVGPFIGYCGNFLTHYSCIDSTFWPQNRDAFIYMAKSARQPYASAPGPTTLSLQTIPSHTIQGSQITITATVNDGLFGFDDGVGSPSTQNISQAEMYIDTPPWAGGTPLSMSAQDGAFNSPQETVVRALKSKSLTTGRHTVYVRAQDTDGFWGPTSTQWLYIEPEVTQFYPVAATTGNTITITGKGFDENTQVFFGGLNRIPATSVRVESSTTLSAEVPPSFSGVGNINGYLTIVVNGASTTTQNLPVNVSNPGDPASTFPDFVLWGDTAQNGDAVTAADLALARAILLNQFTPTTKQRLAVDVTPLNENRSRGDGTYDQADYDFLQLVSQFLASF